MEKTRRMGWVGGFMISLCLVLGSPVGGHADLKDILLRFQPSIDLQEEYTNNIGLASTNKKGDSITSIYPGIRFSTLPRSETTREFRREEPTGAERYGVDLNYRLGLVFYGKETNLNYVGHEGSLNAWYTVAPRLTFRLTENLVRSEDPREQEYPGASPTYISGTFVNLTNLYLLGADRQRSVYLRNVAAPSIEYGLGRDSSISLNYRNNIYRNQNPASEDSQEDYINPRLTYWFNIRNGVSFEYGLTLGNFQRSPDLIGHMAVGRYTYRFNPRTSIFGEYSFLSRDFRDPGIDYKIHKPGIGMEHAFSPTLSTMVLFGYFWQSREKGSGDSRPFYNVVLTQRGERVTYALLMQGGYQEDFYTAENRGFTLYHRAVGSVSYRILERVTTGLSGSYEWAKSPLAETGQNLPSHQRDDIWRVNGNVAYQMLRWLNLSLNLSYAEDHSNVESLGYTEFRGLFRISATY